MVGLNTGRIGHVFGRTRVRLNHSPKGLSTPSRAAMRAEDLTDRQHEVLEHIREHIRRWGMPPSRSELARSLGLAFGSAVNYHLRALERKGWIQLNPGRDRGIQLLREGTPVFDPDRLPEVAAGTPILADESKAVMRVPDELSRQIHPQADFYVVVRGDSMSSVGYRTGDIIAIKRTPDAAEGRCRDGPHRDRDHAKVLPQAGRRPGRADAVQQQSRAPADRDRRADRGLGDRRRGRRSDDRTVATGSSRIMSPAPNGFARRTAGACPGGFAGPCGRRPEGSSINAARARRASALCTGGGRRGACARRPADSAPASTTKRSGFPSSSKKSRQWRASGRLGQWTPTGRATRSCAACAAPT